MKQLKGKTQNIDTGIVGKITTKHQYLSSRKNLIYVTNDKYPSKGYLATITSSSNLTNKALQYVEGVKNISELRDNDIVIIEPNGNISELFDSTSKFDFYYRKM